MESNHVDFIITQLQLGDPPSENFRNRFKRFPWPDFFLLTRNDWKSTTPSMGLDGVEIVMAVEQDFGIQIEDSEAEQILTPGQLIDLVMSKVATTTTDICLTHRSFNLLRQFFVRRYAFSRNQLKPDTSLQTTLPRTRRLAQLQELSTELAMGDPTLNF
jgi:hypothetical protein